MVNAATDLDSEGVGAGAMLYVTGGCLSIVWIMYNAFRSFRYDRPHPAVSLVDPEAWYVAVVPGMNGGIQTTLAYTIRF